MKSFIEQALFYREYHQSKVNLYTHLIGVPLLIFSSMIFLGFFRIISPGLFDISLAEIATLVILAYYIYLNWRLGLLLVPVFLILLWLSALISHRGATNFSVWFFIIVFVSGWAFQLAGHFLEGKKPAFMSNARQALVAPLFLMAEIGFIFGFFPKLKTMLHGDEPVVKVPPQDDVIPPS